MFFIIKRRPNFAHAKFVSNNLKNEMNIQFQRMPEGLKEFTQAKMMLQKGDEPTQEMHNLFSQANKNPENLLLAQRVEVLEYLISSKFSTKENIKSCYKTILELEPDNTEYLSMYAEYLMDIESLEESVKIWKHVLTLEPKNLIASIRLADCYIQLESYKEAEELLSRALLVQNLNPQLHEKKATLLFKLGKLEECLEFCERSLEIHKNSKILKNIQLQSLFKTEKYTTFLQKVENYIKEFPNEASLFSHEKIMSLIETEKFKEALKEIKPDNPKSDIYKALTYKKMGEYSLAESLFLKAIETNPDSEELCHQLGIIHYARDSVESMVYFDKALQINPKHLPSLLAFAEGQMRLGSTSEAIQFLDTAIEINPNDVGPRIDRGRCYALKGDFKKAITEFDKVLEMDPNNLKALEKKGSALIGYEKPREGIALLEKCITLGHDDTHSIWNNLGTAYYAIEDFKRSLECFDRGLLLNPGAKDLKENREQALLNYDIARDSVRMQSNSE